MGRSLFAVLGAIALAGLQPILIHDTVLAHGAFGLALLLLLLLLLAATLLPTAALLAATLLALRVGRTRREHEHDRCERSDGCGASHGRYSVSSSTR